MNSTIAAKKNKRILERIKLLVVIFLLILAIVGNYCYRDYKVAIRTIAMICIITIAGSIAIMTAKGKSAVLFARKARIEIRKVIWPSSQETLHTTLIVAAMTAAMLVIMWALDSILVRFVSFITGLRF